MCKGYTNRVLEVDLKEKTVRTRAPGPELLRMYLGGGGLGSYFLLSKGAAKEDPLGPGNVLTIAPGVTTGAKVSGVSRFSVTAISPLTGCIGDGQAGGDFGPWLKRAGYDAIIITGKADSAVYLYVDQNRAQIRDASHLSGHRVSVVLDKLEHDLGKQDLAILQCGPAGEKLVRFACLVSGRNDVIGRTGMGAVFGSKNLRAVVVKAGSGVSFADGQGLSALNRKAAKRLADTGFPSVLRKYGTPGVVAAQAKAGNLCTRNFTRGSIEGFEKLDGSNFEAEIGAGSRTCYGCVVACRKRVKSSGKYNISDALGGPEFETLGMLGSNLEITDPMAVAKANELCNEYGMDTITMGGIASYLCEAMDREIITAKDLDGIGLAFGNPDALFELIHKVGKRQGVGDILAEGFEAAITRMGEDTRAFAVQTRNQAFAVHMPQVKPSLSIIYATNPFGPDHQSSEHDWLLAAGGDICRGLGITGSGDASSVGPAKVRMTAFSQIYYSLLDTLGLCQFCWGPGSLFSYRELEDLVNYSTGWDITFHELLAAGERRINLMRWINHLRGFGAGQDKLPERVFEALGEGPSKGRKVNRKEFETMLHQYYAIMGWEQSSGVPGEGKMLSLGLEWTLPGGTDDGK
ncbi:MAG: aldehyde:ferredoxin oxidoreductase [Deltaproteobacteria bacterium]|nr:aldehyde:ferredoxin oxidoreductase [Deltaproteobacteria bacterium]